MRVLMISLDRGLLGIGASGDSVERHKRYADLVGSLDVIVFAPREAREKIWAGNFRVYPSDSEKFSHYQRAADLAKRFASTHAYDLLVTQDFASPVGQILKFDLGIPWVVSVHSMFFSAAWLRFSPVNWYLLFRLRRAMRFADGFRVNNLTIRDKLRSWGIKKPILVQPTPVDIQKFKMQNAKIKMTMQNAKLKILYVGRLSPEKNVGMLIKAVRELRMANIELRIVGLGVEEARLKALAAGDERVQFLGGKSTEELPAIYQSADIFVLPSNTESFGKVLIEAAASGCALIATATAGAKMILGESENGVVIPANSREHLTEALLNLLNKRYEREYWSARAKEMAEKYDAGDGIRKTVDFWNSIISNLTRPPATLSDVGEGRVR